MKKILVNPLFKRILFGVLFVLASFATRMGFVLMVPVITNQGRYLLTALPAIVGCWFPLLSLILLWIKWNSNSVARQWKITFIYGLLATSISVLLLADQIIMSAVEYHWVLHATELSPLFPYDVIALLVLFLGLGIYSLIKSGLTKADLLVAPVEENLKGKGIVAVWFFLTFACYFNGAAFSFITGLDAYDPNWPFMIPAFLAFFLMVEAMVMYVIYKQGNEETKQKRHFLGIIVMLTSITVLAVWIGIGIIINPYLYPESLSQYYTLGYAIKVPFGAFLTFIGALAPTIVAIVRYFKRYKVKK